MPAISVIGNNFPICQFTWASPTIGECPCFVQIGNKEFRKLYFTFILLFSDIFFVCLFLRTRSLSFIFIIMRTILRVTGGVGKGVTDSLKNILTEKFFEHFQL
jgi:hypothetical protein